VVVLGRREADGRHALGLGEVITPEELREKGGITRATERIAAALERFVRERPAQWLWLHRRWKEPRRVDRSPLVQGVRGST
jgi:KDO2-lipid IV(A) lauroyltransferase